MSKFSNTCRASKHKHNLDDGNHCVKLSAVKGETKFPLIKYLGYHFRRQLVSKSMIQILVKRKDHDGNTSVSLYQKIGTSYAWFWNFLSQMKLTLNISKVAVQVLQKHKLINSDCTSIMFSNLMLQVTIFRKKVFA